MQDRDFKGVWIPKEIWLCKDLSALDKVILAEIDSLDNEKHCWASNEYFAEFCGVGIATITRSIKKLSELGYIESEMKDGRHRVIKMIRVSNQNDEGASSKRLTNNIANSIEDNTISIDIVLQDDGQLPVSSLENDFIGSAKKTKKKRGSSVYNKCYLDILGFTNNAIIQNLLDEYLKFRLQVKDKPLYYNMWKGMLDKLSELSSGDVDDMRKIIQKSLESGWLSFYPLKSERSKLDKFGEDENVRSDKGRKESSSGKTF